jgi:EAL domain-containing protein (putative c-di-GMP-specific phosphodiesterase class I)/DNA-binding response OmpR family regulator
VPYQNIQQLAKGSENRSLLIVEDDLNLSLSLVRILKVFFKDYVIATDGEEALQFYTARLDTNPFTLVLTDLELPKIGGLRLISKIRSLNKKQNIIILSAHDESEYMSEAIRLDVQSYLLKPLIMSKLFESLEKVFGLNQQASLVQAGDKKERATDWGTFDELSNHILTLERPVVLMRLRLNHFNSIVMLLGELYANEYLTQLTQLLESLTSDENGKFYRISVDEFCLILDGNSIDEAITLANTMVSVVRYFNTSDHGIILNSTLSIGISYGLNSVLLHSKIALDKTEDHINGGVVHYTHDDICNDITIDQSRKILKMIFNAINEENIIPYFQSIVEVDSGDCLIYESLIRIKKGNKIFTPDAFLNLAKEMGQMSMISRSMIRATLDIRRSIDCQKIVAINITTYDLTDEGIIPYIRFWIKRYNISPSTIAFILTEGIEALNNKSVIASIKELQADGHKIILNNFGAGQCSFMLLLLLKPDYIKIHQDLIQKIETDSMYLAIVKNMTDIISKIGSKSIASHISTETQKNLLKQCNINYLQGFLFDEPFEIKNTLNEN